MQVTDKRHLPAALADVALHMHVVLARQLSESCAQDTGKDGLQLAACILMLLALTNKCIHVPLALTIKALGLTRMQCTTDT